MKKGKRAMERAEAAAQILMRRAQGNWMMTLR